MLFKVLRHSRDHGEQGKSISGAQSTSILGTRSNMGVGGAGLGKGCPILAQFWSVESYLLASLAMHVHT